MAPTVAVRLPLLHNIWLWNIHLLLSLFLFVLLFYMYTRTRAHTHTHTHVCMRPTIALRGIVIVHMPAGLLISAAKGDKPIC